MSKERRPRNQRLLKGKKLGRKNRINKLFAGEGIFRMNLISIALGGGAVRKKKKGREGGHRRAECSNAMAGKLAGCKKPTLVKKRVVQHLVRQKEPYLRVDRLLLR